MKINISKASVELTAAFVFCLILVSNLMILQFAKGYFSYFNIPIELINFTPDLYDYLGIAFPSILYSLIIIGVVYILFRIVDKSIVEVTQKIHIPKINKLVEGLIATSGVRITKLLSTIEVIMKIAIVCLFLHISIVIVTDTMPKLGRVSAENTKSFTAISGIDSSKRDLIVYTQGGSLYIKTYDIKQKKFTDGYKFMSKIQYSTESFKIQ